MMRVMDKNIRKKEIFKFAMTFKWALAVKHILNELTQIIMFFSSILNFSNESSSKSYYLYFMRIIFHRDHTQQPRTVI